MRIIYTGDGAEQWTVAAEELVKYVNDHFFILGALPFSLNNNTEVIVSILKRDIQVDILSGDLLAHEIKIRKCIAVGTSSADYRVYFVDDQIWGKGALFDYYMPGQVVGDKVEDGKQVSIIAPRISEGELKSVVESGTVSEDRETFGKVVSYYHDVICQHMHKNGLLHRHERIIDVGIIEDTY